MSRPARARGLKHRNGHDTYQMDESRPARARGVKLFDDAVVDGVGESRPARARGLKHPFLLHTAGQQCRAPRGRVD